MLKNHFFFIKYQNFEDTASLEVNVRSIMKMKYVKIKAVAVRHAEDATQGSANTFVKT